MPEVFQHLQIKVKHNVILNLAHPTMRSVREYPPSPNEHELIIFLFCVSYTFFRTADGKHLTTEIPFLKDVASQNFSKHNITVNIPVTPGPMLAINSSDRIKYAVSHLLEDVLLFQKRDTTYFLPYFEGTYSSGKTGGVRHGPIAAHVCDETKTTSKVLFFYLRPQKSSSS